MQEKKTVIFKEERNGRKEKAFELEKCEKKTRFFKQNHPLIDRRHYIDNTIFIKI